MSDLSQTLEREAYARSSIVLPLEIDAGQMVSIPVYGDAFYLVGATGEVEIKTDTTAGKPYRRGTGERFPTVLRFERLEVYNRAASGKVTLRLWVGFGEYVDRRAELAEAYTELAAQASQSIAGNATLSLSGAPSGARRVQRKAIVVSNVDPNTALVIVDGAGNHACAVFPNTSVTLPISGPCGVKNPTGVSVSCYVAEIWYLDSVL